MGIIFNGVDNADQVRRMVQEMHYPQLGPRSISNLLECGATPLEMPHLHRGASEDEYVKRADR